jgi:hypothetical protein
MLVERREKPLSRTRELQVIGDRRSKSLRLYLFFLLRHVSLAVFVFVVRKLHNIMDQNKLQNKHINTKHTHERKGKMYDTKSFCGAGLHYTKPALVHSSTLSMNSANDSKTCL